MPIIAEIPRTGPWRLANVTVPGCLLDPPSDSTLVNVSIDIDADGRIAAIDGLSRSSLSLDAVIVDGKGSMVWPGLVDMHTHLDKGHIWPRRPNPDGSFDGALEAVGKDRRAHWSAEDVAARMDFSLRCAYAHGSVAVRTHLDSDPPQHEISWPVFSDMREKWAGRIDLQAVCLVIIDTIVEPFASKMVQHVAAHGGVMGAVTYHSPELEQQLDLLFELAARHELDLDFHVDEILDPQAQTLSAIADAALRCNFPHQVVVGHCCSLSVQDPATVATVLGKVADAGIAVVSLPMCNMYLQDRQANKTPRRRGVTLLHELRAADIPVAVASDNTRDPFYAYGDMDLLEVFSQSVRIAHLDHPVGEWPATICRTPAAVMGVDAGVLSVGSIADLVICPARSFSELLSRPQSGRVVVRAGRAIDARPPDYRELDHLYADMEVGA